MGIHRYACITEEWDDLVDAVLDIMKRTSKIVNVVDYRWDMDVRVDKKIITLDPNDFNGSFKDKIHGMVRCIFEILEQEYAPEKSVVLEVRYHQEDFFADLDVYEWWQTAVQADACGAETEEEKEILANAILNNKEKRELFQELMGLVENYRNV